MKSRSTTRRGALMGMAMAVALAGCSDQTLQDVATGQKPLPDQLATAVVATPKRTAEVDLCAPLSASEIAAAMRRHPLGPPRHANGLCTWSFATSLPDIHDSIMISDTGRMTGEPATVRGNSALLTPSGLGCTVTVAVAPREPGRVSTDAVSVRYTHEHQDTAQHCRQAHDLATRVVDRLPPA